MSTLAIGEVPEEQEAFLIKEKEAQGTSVPEHHPGKKVTVMVDGPYGGLKLQLERYEEVLVVAGGSGVTYLLGTIEEALRVWDRGSGPKKMKAAWVVAEYCRWLDSVSEHYSLPLSRCEDFGTHSGTIEHTRRSRRHVSGVSNLLLPSSQSPSVDPRLVELEHDF